MTQTKQFHKDECIIQKGTMCEQLYLIEKGTVHVKERGRTVLELGEGAFFAEINYLAEFPTQEDYYAADQTTIACIANPFEFFEQNQELHMKLLKTISYTSRNLLERLHRLSPTAKISLSKEWAVKEIMEKEAMESEAALETSEEQAGNVLTGNAPEENAPEENQQSENGQTPAAGEGKRLTAPILKDKPSEKLSVSYSSRIKNIILPDNFKEYLFIKQPVMDHSITILKTMDCPSCTHKFKYRVPAFSKIVVKSINSDLRKVYKDFDVLWYSILTCPNCYYSNYTANYKPLYGKTLTKLNEHLSSVEHNLNIDPTREAEINSVLIDYYAALYTAKCHKSNSLIEAKLWMNLGWLYEDLGDDDESFNAFKKALTEYENVYRNATIKLTTSQNQELTIVMAELSLKMGDPESALQYFRKSIAREAGSNAQINRRAQDRIQEVRDLVRV